MPPVSDYDPIFEAAGKEWNVDPNLLRAIAAQETGGASDPNRAVSSANAQGLMQIIPETQKHLGITDPTDPVQSIYGGAKYLSEALDNEKTPEAALLYYHGGPDWRDHYGPESQAYVPGVVAHYKQLTAANGNTTPPPRAAAGDTAVASAKAKDPSGDDILNAYMAPSSATASGTPAAAAPSGSSAPGQSILDAYRTADAPVIAEATNDNAAEPTSIPAVNNLLAGTRHGIQSVVDTANRASAYVDRNVPILARLDALFGQNPQAAVDAQPAAEAAYQAKYGNSNWASAGNVLGQGIATAPLILAGGAGLGMLGGAVAEGAGGAATALGRGIQAGTDLVTGSAAAPGAGFVGNALARGTGMMTSGALGGAGTAVLVGDDPVTGAKTGALAGPLVGGLGNTAGLAWTGSKALGKGAVSAVNMLTGRVSTKPIDQEIDAAISRAKGGNVLAGAPPTPAVAATEATAPTTATAPTIATAPTTSTAPTTATLPPAAAAAPVPTSVGAAATTPSDLTANAMTAAQAEASRATGFNYRMAQQAKEGYDNLEYVKGSKPTLAEQLGDPALAAQQRVIAAGNEDFAALDRANNEARIDHFDNLAGTPTTLQTLVDARDAQAQADLAAAWANKAPVDATPVLDRVNAALAGPDGKLGPVRAALNEVKSSLQNADGSLETDPEQLYGARKNIAFLMSKVGRAANPGYADGTVMRQLGQAKDALDAVIEPGAPGYQKYLNNYAAASKPIDVQELLQSYRPNLLDASGNMQLSRVNTMMKSIGQKMASDVVNPAKSLDDDTVDQLFNLRSDLLRQNNRNLARPAGSDTQNNQTVANEMGLNAVTAGAHVLASHVPGGNLLVGPAMTAAVKSSNAKIQAHLTNRLLNGLPLLPQ